ncbi:MAG: hypothetical protein ABSG80_03445 [Verrucomicrobiota bacterium]
MVHQLGWSLLETTAAENLQGARTGGVDNLSGESCEFPRKLKNRPSNLEKSGPAMNKKSLMVFGISAAARAKFFKYKDAKARRKNLRAFFKFLRG